MGNCGLGFVGFGVKFGFVNLGCLAWGCEFVNFENLAWSLWKFDLNFGRLTKPPPLRRGFGGG